jgi:hypothetical protein
VAKFLRIPFSLLHAIRTASRESPSCRITVWVLGDTEVYESPQDFQERVGPQTLRRFDQIEVDVDSEALQGIATLVRRPGQPSDQGGRSGEAGVYLLVAPADGHSQTCAARVVAHVLPAIGRGSLGWQFLDPILDRLGRRRMRWMKELVIRFREWVNYRPTTSSSEIAGSSECWQADGIEQALRQRNRNRDYLMRTWAALAALLGGTGAAWFARAYAGNESEEAVLAIIAVVTIIAVGCIVFNLPGSRAIKNFVFPPVELASITPGRRIIKFLLTVAGPGLLAALEPLLT